MEETRASGAALPTPGSQGENTPAQLRYTLPAQIWPRIPGSLSSLLLGKPGDAGTPGLAKLEHPSTGADQKRQQAPKQSKKPLAVKTKSALG